MLELNRLDIFFAFLVKLHKIKDKRHIELSRFQSYSDLCLLLEKESMAFTDFKVVYNSSEMKGLNGFADINDRVSCGSVRNVCFARAVGVNRSFLSDLKTLEDILTEKSRKGLAVYARIGKLTSGIPYDKTEYYSDSYDMWVASGRTYLRIKTSGLNEKTVVLLNRACKAALGRLVPVKEINGNSGFSSIEKNFFVKVMFWFDGLPDDIKKATGGDLPVKLAADNVLKKHEYLFFYMLTQAGVNVLLIQSRADISAYEEGMELSHKTVLGGFDNSMKIPVYGSDVSGVSSAKQSSEQAVPTLKLPERNRVKKHSVPEISQKYAVNTGRENKAVNSADRKEKTYEELAALARSVVMISLHNRNGDVIGVGSGIMIARSGYILTNNHVAKGAAYYSVKIENDDRIYYTDDIVKNNYMLDLALIRIERMLDPIPVYNGRKELVRGQRVIAIGSPLGLFNSVSDGIISGFRIKSDEVRMIQFTAPISNGSSGGAVLNMYGEIIGISTAGIDEGQNINLAIDYIYINEFIRGFV